MVITKNDLSYCQLEFYNHYAILQMNEGTELSIERGLEIRGLLKDYYKQNDFIFITNRVYKHSIDLGVYKEKGLRNMKGFAIVSKNPSEQQRAMKEQELWNKAFVFFRDMNDATDWAESFF